MRILQSKHRFVHPFGYNTFIRGLMKDKPSIAQKTAIECCKIKKTFRGKSIYDKSDLFFI